MQYTCACDLISTVKLEDVSCIFQSILCVALYYLGDIFECFVLNFPASQTCSTNLCMSEPSHYDKHECNLI